MGKADSIQGFIRIVCGWCYWHKWECCGRDEHKWGAVDDMTMNVMSTDGGAAVEMSTNGGTVVDLVTNGGARVFWGACFPGISDLSISHDTWRISSLLLHRLFSPMM
jgi:hypothetical protein